MWYYIDIDQPPLNAYRVADLFEHRGTLLLALTLTFNSCYKKNR
ncbi:MAG: hypothetical protein ACFFAN_02870 [Promethearchaeota archaeon]